MSRHDSELPPVFDNEPPPVFDNEPPPIHDSEPPPILGRWRNLNIVVLCWLAFVILVMYAFTRYFA